MIRISGSRFGLSVSTRPTQTNYLYLPDGKMATIRLTRMAFEPAGSTPYQNEPRMNLTSSRAGFSIMRPKRAGEAHLGLGFSNLPHTLPKAADLCIRLGMSALAARRRRPPEGIARARRWVGGFRGRELGWVDGFPPHRPETWAQAGNAARRTDGGEEQRVATSKRPERPGSFAFCLLCMGGSPASVAGAPLCL